MGSGLDCSGALATILVCGNKGSSPSKATVTGGAKAAEKPKPKPKCTVLESLSKKFRENGQSIEEFTKVYGIV